MEKVYFHVDLDAFFASVEQVDFPEYRNKPVIIGAAPGQRGVVAACSYEARKYGIHSAMPISQAYKRCRNGIYLPVRMKRYQEVSKKVMEILKTYSPEVMQISVDEAFLDLTGTERLFGSPEDTAEKLKAEITEQTGLTISIGIAANRLLAKMGSDFNKPDGICFIQNGQEIEFLDKLKLKDLWGLGKKTLERLEELNITTIPELRNISLEILQRIIGKAGGTFLFKAARGIDPGIFSEETKSHSISSEVTFEIDTHDLEGIKKVFLELSHQVMFRLINSDYKAKTVFIKLRYSDFKTISARNTLQHYLSSAEEIYAVAYKLFTKKWNKSDAIRLIGLGIASLEKNNVPEQHELFEDKYDKKKKVEQAVLKIRKKGNPMVKASLLKKKKSP